MAQDFDALWTRYMRVFNARGEYATPEEYAGGGWNTARLLRDVKLSMQVTGQDAADVANAIAAEFEARGYPLFRDLDTLTLTTAHAASSYGRPVLVIGGEAYGPADMTPAGLTAAELLGQWAAHFGGQAEGQP
jgi:hypothetical protein